MNRYDSPTHSPSSYCTLPCHAMPYPTMPCPTLTLPYLIVTQVGSDIRQVLHAMQMWRAKSQVMAYGELKNGMRRIEKDKVTLQSPLPSHHVFTSLSDLPPVLSMFHTFPHYSNPWFLLLALAYPSMSCLVLYYPVLVPILSVF